MTSANREIQIQSEFLLELLSKYKDIVRLDKPLIGSCLTLPETIDKITVANGFAKNIITTSFYNTETAFEQNDNLDNLSEAYKLRQKIYGRLSWDENNYGENIFPLLTNKSKKQEIWEVATEVQYKTHRFDMVVWWNGIPLYIVEWKKDNRVEDAKKDFRDYVAKSPSAFACSPILLAADHVSALEYSSPWNVINSEWAKWGSTDAFEAIVNLFNPAKAAIINIYFSLFVLNGTKVKTHVVPRKHQVDAANRAVKRFFDKEDNKGLIQHHQGSGKSLLMTYISQWAIMEMANAKITYGKVLLFLDRTELNEQISETLGSSLQLPSIGGAFSKAETAEELNSLLSQSGLAVIVANIQLFSRGNSVLFETIKDRNILVLSDEAHRSEGGQLGDSRNLYMPNATYIGLTGTPIQSDITRDTYQIFSSNKDPNGILDRYEMKQALEEGVVVNLSITEVTPETKVNPVLEKNFNEQERQILLSQFKKARSDFSEDEIFLKYVLNHILYYHSHSISPGLKGMIVLNNIKACAKMIEIIRRPDTNIYGYDASQFATIFSPDPLYNHLREKDEKLVKKNFCDENHKLKFIIVCNKLLTGFDAPILGSLYMAKNMEQPAQLFQAITRVNRALRNSSFRKPSGHVVLYTNRTTPEVVKDAIKTIENSKKVFGTESNLDMFKENLSDLSISGEEKVSPEYLALLLDTTRLWHSLTEEERNEIRRNKLLTANQEAVSQLNFLSEKPLLNLLEVMNDYVNIGATVSEVTEQLEIKGFDDIKKLLQEVSTYTNETSEILSEKTVKEQRNNLSVAIQSILESHFGVKISKARSKDYTKTANLLSRQMPNKDVLTSNFILAKPNAYKTLSAFKSLGYTYQDSIADLVDNSIDAKANNIHIKIENKENNEYKTVFSVSDDGIGMDANILTESLKLGSDTPHAPRDLGKFGIGLISASLALGDKIEIFTKKGKFGQSLYACLDMQIVKERNDFYIVQRAANPEEISEHFKSSGGTKIVIYSNENKKKLETVKKDILSHCGRVFRYFVGLNTKENEQVNIFVNDEIAKPRDPMMRESVKKGEKKFDQTIWVESLDLHIPVTIYLLPFLTKEEIDEQDSDLKINQANQGMFIMRNQRELVAGDNKPMMPGSKHNDYNRIRGEIMLYSAMDKVVGTVVQKNKLQLNVEVIDEIRKKIQGQVRDMANDIIKENKNSKASIISDKETSDTAKKRLDTKLTDEETHSLPLKDFEYRFDSFTPDGPIYDIRQENGTTIAIVNKDHFFYDVYFKQNETAIYYMLYAMAKAEKEGTPKERDSIKKLRLEIGNVLNKTLKSE